MDDLVTWLRAQLQAEREQALEVGVDGGSALDDEHRYGGLIITGRRLLDQTDAMLRILDRVAEPGGPYDDPNDDEQRALEYVIRCLALPYADRPGYRDEWRPA